MENIETELTYNQNPPFYNFLMTKILALYDDEEGIELDINHDLPDCILGIHDCFIRYRDCKIYFARYNIGGKSTCVIYDENK